MRIAAPLSESSLDKVVRQAALSCAQNPHILDIGCGKGELVLGLLQQTKGRGLGLDISGEAIACAQSRRDELGLQADFRQCCASEFSIQQNHFQIACCLGSVHALGGLQPTLDALSMGVEPTGLVLVGDLFWKGQPEPRHLTEMGMSFDDLTPSLSDFLCQGQKHRLSPVFCHVSTQQEWDDYEWSLIAAVDRHLFRSSDEPEAEMLRRRLEFMRRSYLEWRRDSMGFATVIYRNARLEHRLN